MSVGPWSSRGSPARDDVPLPQLRRQGVPAAAAGCCRQPLAASGNLRPCDPNHPRQLLGWRVKAIFPTGPRQEDAWREGFVFEVQQHREEGVTTYSLRIFYPFDLEDEFVNGWELPAEDKDFCFIKANTKASGGSKVDARERERAEELHPLHG